MNWQNVTLEHYQALYPVITSTQPDWEKDMQIVSILFNLTEKQLDALPLDKYRELKKACAFLYQPIPQTGERVFYGRKRKYKLLKDVRKMPFARYAEIKSFTGSNEGDFIKNLHLLIASMVQPYKKILGCFWIKETYDASKHADYADDLLSAKFTSVYGAAVFFYLLFTYSIKSLPHYMTSQMEKMQVSNPQEAYTLLLNTLDGFITQNKLPTLKASQLKRLGRLIPSRHSTS